MPSLPCYAAGHGLRFFRQAVVRPRARGRRRRTRHAEAHAKAVLAAIRESREDSAIKTDLYRTALLVQGAAVVALVVALVKLL